MAAGNTVHWLASNASFAKPTSTHTLHWHFVLGVERLLLSGSLCVSVNAVLVCGEASGGHFTGFWQAFPLEPAPLAAH